MSRFRQADLERALRAGRAAGGAFTVRIEAATGDLIVSALADATPEVHEAGPPPDFWASRE